MNTCTRLAFLLALCLLWLPATAEAHRPRGTPMSGIIRSVDATTRKIVFAQDQGPVREFVWSTIAKFWHNQPDTSPTALKPGMRVQVNLHNPLFGPDYVTRIVLLQAPGK
jgi:Cu/Ag efflux protein CusF